MWSVELWQLGEDCHSEPMWAFRGGQIHCSRELVNDTGPQLHVLKDRVAREQWWMVTVINCQRKSLYIHEGLELFCLESCESRHNKYQRDRLQTGLEKLHTLFMQDGKYSLFSGLCASLETCLKYSCNFRSLSSSRLTVPVLFHMVHTL